jgi:hypothetical protein
LRYQPPLEVVIDTALRLGMVLARRSAWLPSLTAIACGGQP